MYNSYGGTEAIWKNLSLLSWQLFRKRLPMKHGDRVDMADQNGKGDSAVAGGRKNTVWFDKNFDDLSHCPNMFPVSSMSVFLNMHLLCWLNLKSCQKITGTLEFPSPKNQHGKPREISRSSPFCSISAIWYWFPVISNMFISSNFEL